MWLTAGRVGVGLLVAGAVAGCSSVKLCEAYATVEQLDRFATTVFVSERVGTPGPDRPGFPVVVRDRVACEDVQLQAGPAGAVAEASDLPISDRLRDWQESRRFNSWRAREALWRDLADGGCLDLAAAREQALTAQAKLDGDWPVFETAADPGHPCMTGCAWTCDSGAKASSTSATTRW